MKFQDKSLNVIKGELQDGIMISCNDSMEYWHYNAQCLQVFRFYYSVTQKFKMKLKNTA